MDQHNKLETNFANIIRNFSGEIWACDDFKQDCSYQSRLLYYFCPLFTRIFQFFIRKFVVHSISDSYTQITNFIQGYIDNEANFNIDGSCTKTCEDYDYIEHQGCKNYTICTINYLDKNKTRCDGKIRSCTFVESDMRLCPNVSINAIPNK